MENTLQVGDRIAVNKLATFFGEIKRGEVVVFRDPANWLGEAQVKKDNSPIGRIKSSLEWAGVLPDPAKQYLIKRTIGVGGDHVVCCDKSGFIQVNGVSIHEPYIFKGNKPSESTFDVTVPKGYIWVMGDHRGASADSRFHMQDPNHGMVPLKYIVGRAQFVIWPFNRLGYLPTGTELSRVSVSK